MAQVIEHLPIKFEALSSIPNKASKIFCIQTHPSIHCHHLVQAFYGPFWIMADDLRDNMIMSPSRNPPDILGSSG
jgi:hypothetical protein